MIQNSSHTIVGVFTHSINQAMIKRTFKGNYKEVFQGHKTSIWNQFSSYIADFRKENKSKKVICLVAIDNFAGMLIAESCIHLKVPFIIVEREPLITDILVSLENKKRFQRPIRPKEIQDLAKKNILKKAALGIIDTSYCGKNTPKTTSYIMRDQFIMDHSNFFVIIDNRSNYIGIKRVKALNSKVNWHSSKTINSLIKPIYL